MVRSRWAHGLSGRKRSTRWSGRAERLARSVAGHRHQREVPRRAGHRPWGHGAHLLRHAGAARSARRPEDRQGRLGQRGGVAVPQALPPRGEHPREAPASERRHAVRLRAHRRCARRDVLHRDGVSERRDAHRAPPFSGCPPGPRGTGALSPDRARPPRGTRARDRPSRHQAVEHRHRARVRRRDRQARRLRHRQGRARRRGSHPRRRARRDAEVHGARAVRRSVIPRERRLRARHHRLSDPDRRAPLRREHDGRLHDREAPASRSGDARREPDLRRDRYPRAPRLPDARAAP